MRSIRRNKTKMRYALLVESVPVYETDEDGNVVFIEEDGEQIPVETGSSIPIYSSLVDFMASIHGAGGEAEAEAYGISLGAYDAVLYDVVGCHPIDETSRIWVDSEPEFNDDGTVKPESADYIVKRVPPSLNDIVYLLARIEK